MKDNINVVILIPKLWISDHPRDRSNFRKILRLKISKWIYARKITTQCFDIFQKVDVFKFRPIKISTDFQFWPIKNGYAIEPLKAHGLLVRGSLPLDALTFEKVVTSHEYVLVKFDTAYPFGDLHDEWKDIAKFSARNTELIAAEININQDRLLNFNQI